MEKARKAKLTGSGKIKHSKSFYKLEKRSQLLDKPSVVAISSTGINTKPKDVKLFMKKNNLVLRAGVIRRV